MSKSWLNFYYMTDAEFQAEVAARNAKRLSAANGTTLTSHR
jgi:hypothetical protein